MKSQASILLNLQIALLLDAEAAIPGYSSNRDQKEVSHRMEHIGVSFFEKILPTLDDLLLEGLSSGSFPSMTGWKRKKGYSHPEFLHGLWAKVFSPSGKLVSNPSVESILFIRQISRLSKKIFEVCDDGYVNEALSAFIEVDREVGRLPSRLPFPFASEVAKGLFGKTIGKLFEEDSVGYRHGPGAVAERLDSVEKYNFSTLSPRIVDEVGVDPFRLSYSDMESPHIEEIPARLVAVPKTATKPRLIAIEPSYNQFIQQGFQAMLKNEMSRSPIWSYHDQGPNQDLARRGSIDGSYSTIDLSEASDRVSWNYVKQMFSFNKNFVRMLTNTRSIFLDVPGHGTRVLHKYASMGSALTFPVEMMYFSTIIGVAIGRLIKNDSVKAIHDYLSAHEVRVYGDDIIVPTQLAQILIETLEAFGLKVNTNKSFTSGLFRESCGADWYNGYAVEPIYLRRRFPQSGHDVDSLISLASFRDQLYNKALFPNTVSVCDELLGRHSAVKIPDHYQLPEAVCIRTPLSEADKVFRDPNLQTCRIKARVPSRKRKLTRASDASILFKSLYEGFSEDDRHLTHHVRPISATLKYRWVNLRLA